MLVLGIWAAGNEMPCLSAFETDPSIAVVGGDLACIALRGLHGVLAPKLRVRGLWACHLRLSLILHWSLIPWCSIAEASWFLEAILLVRLAFQKLALVIFPFINFGSFCKNRLVHQCIEIRIDLRGKQGPEFRVQSLFEHVLLLFIIVHFFWCISGQLHELMGVLFHRHGSLLQCAELIRLALHSGRGNMISAELLHKLFPCDGGGIFGSSAV